MTGQGELLLLLLGYALILAAVVRWIRHHDDAAAERRARTRWMLERERMRQTYREGTR